MRSSQAFETIDDPLDPAWSGNADLPRIGRSSVLLWLILSSVALVAFGLVVFVQQRSHDQGTVIRSSEPSQKERGEGQRLPALVIPQIEREAVEQIQDTASGTTSPTSSGWAPAQVTKQAYSPSRVTGDTSGISPLVTGRLDEVAHQLGAPISVVSGWRTNHEQSKLYRQYLAGTGNLAAVPGTSMHERGRAADVYVDGVALANVPAARRIARAHGLHFPVAGEPWHVELVGDPQGSGQ